ncbi:tetratricopeptide repeat protein [Chryseobacterium wanjuense]
MKDVFNRGYEAAMVKIKSNSKKYQLKENLIERYGYKLLFEKKYDQAINLFKLNINSFPGSAYGYYNISEAYRISNQKEKAIEFLKIYIEKEPDDKEALSKYKVLKNLN